MNMYLIIFPIPIHHGDSRPLTEYEVKCLLGCFIVLSTLFFISTLIKLINYFFKNKKTYYYDTFWRYYSEDNLLGIFHMTMITIYIIGILIWLGAIIAKYL